MLSVEIDNHGPSRLTLSPVDVAPHAKKPLASFFLPVPLDVAGHEIAAEWLARSSSIPGLVEGTVVIQVSNDGVRGLDLLRVDAEE